MNIVILAAGAGKRMHSAIPKVMHPLAGKPLLAHVIATARSLKPKRICVVIGKNAQLIEQTFSDADICFAVQENPQGTGHALLQALPHLDEKSPTLVLYGDVPLLRAATLQRLIQATSPKQAGLLTAVLYDPAGYGRIVRNSKGIQKIVEDKDASEKELLIEEINTGVMLLPTQHLAKWLAGLENNNAQGEYYLTDVIEQAAQDTRVMSAHPEDSIEIFGINNKAQLAELERVLQQQLANQLLQQGITLIDPKRIDIRGELICGQDVSIDINCIFEGKVVLHNGVKVGAHSVIKNSVVGQHTEIKPFSHIENSVIGSHNEVGPYARVRPETKTATHVKIGNFVEVKKSQIGSHSKINHLSYIGDSEIGKAVNIGAGVITCNFNGLEKFKTVIEDDAFIGSNSQLVAPVTVGKGATIGAGTTLTKNAPAEQLTVTRVSQTTVAGWRRPSKTSKPSPTQE